MLSSLQHVSSSVLVGFRPHLHHSQLAVSCGPRADKYENESEAHVKNRQVHVQCLLW